MGFMDEFNAFMDAFIQDGMEIDGDVIGKIDQEHQRKLLELYNKDDRFWAILQIRLGMDPHDESYYGPDTDIRAINPDHFLIKKELKDRLEEFRQKIYAVIDEVYAIKDTIGIDAELEDYEDNYMTDWDDED